MRHVKLLSAASVVVIIWGLAAARPFLIPLCMAALLALLVAPVVQLARRTGMPEWLALILGAIVLLLPFSGFALIFFHQGRAFSQEVPHILLSLHSSMKNLGLAPLLEPVQLAERLSSSADRAVELVLSGLGAIVTAGSKTALVFLLALLMVATRRRIRSSLEQMLGPGATGTRLLNEGVRLVERFLLMRFLLVLIVATVDTGVLLFFGLKYALLMGAFLGLMTLVPAIGFILGLLPPLAVSLAMGLPAIQLTALILSLLLVAFIEGNILTPAMVGRSVNINLLATFAGLFAGVLLWGVWGMLLAVPILGVVRIVLCSIPGFEPWGELLASETSATTAPVAEPTLRNVTVEPQPREPAA